MPKSLVSPLVHGGSKTEWQEAHAALVGDAELWPRLQFRGVQPGLGADLFEVRSCPCCGSSLNRQITLCAAMSVLAVEAQVIASTCDLLATAKASHA